MRRTAALVVILVMATVSPAAAATKNIQADSGALRWTPSTVSGLVGDTVIWTNDGGDHNVASKTEMFRSEAPPFDTYSRTFSAGTFGFMCEVHFEMQGVVRVRPRLSAAPDGRPFTVRWANAATNTGTSFRVQYRVNAGDWRVWKSGTTSDLAVFGQGGSPVTVKADTNYRFRVRSSRNGNVSGFSPVVLFST